MLVDRTGLTIGRPFVAYVEKAFRDRALRVAVLVMPNVPLASVVRRQILEGVQAVIKLYRASRMTGKIPLQVFDRSQGVNSVHFEGKCYTLFSSKVTF